MRPRTTLLLAVIALAPACRRAADPSGAASARVVDDSAVADPNAAPDEPGVPDGFCHPAAVVSTGRGGAVIDACFDPQANRTDLVGQRLDADAMAVGSRVRIAHVAGNVLSLAAIALDGSLRVAWIAHVGEGAERSDEFSDRGGGARELGVLTVSTTLAVLAPPVRVNRHLVPSRRESERRGWGRSRVELAAGPEHALLVLATDAEGGCPAAGPRCASWSVFSVGPDGAVSRVRHESAASPSLEPQSLIAVGGDLAYVRGTDAVRSTVYVHSLRTGGGAISTMPAATFDPLVDWSSASLAWTGTAVVALGEERPLDAAEPRLVVRVTSLSGPSPTRSRPGSDPDAVRWPVVTERSWRCVRRHPVLRVAWRGGSIELDPTTPGASMDLSRWVPAAVAGIPARPGATRWLPPMAWTGRALVAIDGLDHLRRWTCTRDGQPPTE